MPNSLYPLFIFFEGFPKDDRIDINVKNNCGSSALMLASTDGAVDTVDKLLKVEGVKVNCADENGDTG